VVVFTATLLLVPESREADAPALDWRGLLLSVAAIGTLVFTIIEAPQWGWLSPETALGFGAAAVLMVGFVVWELRVEHPMLPVRIFRNRRFTAASAAITSAFFALFGFIFLITQYFQLIRGYSPLEAGVRTLPVAISIAVASVVAPRIVHRAGTTRVVSTGLVLMAAGFLWVSTASAATPYLEIVGQMILLGVGLGFTTAPATESIMGSVSLDKAGVGSAVLNSMRQIGGSLGIAIMGAVVAHYAGGGRGAAATRDPQAFIAGFHHALELAAVFAFAGAIVAVSTMRKVHHPEHAAVPEGV
jgi:predicted MFS family arabinose efflux permease